MCTVLEELSAVVTLDTTVVIAVSIVLQYVPHDEVVANLAAHPKLIVVALLAVFLIPPSQTRQSAKTYD